MKTFSVREALGIAWKIFKANASILILIVIFQFVFQIAPRAVIYFLPDLNFFPSIVTSLTSFITSAFIGIGMTYVSLQLVDGKKFDRKDVFGRSRVIIKLVIAGFLAGTLVVLGFLLFVIPGIIFLVRYQFVRLAIIDLELGPLEALGKSWELTKGQFWKLILFNIATSLVMLIGFLALGVGLLAAMPVIELANAYVYRKLNTEDQ